MKNYIKPSIEVSKFEVEEIMLSATQLTGGSITQAPTDIDAVTNTVYKDYLQQAGNTAATNGYVEFQW